MEQSGSDIPLHCLPWCKSESRLINSHPTVGATLKVCRKFFPDHLLSPDPSPLFPILGNPLFTPGFSDPVFRSLAAAGCFRATHFIRETEWPTRSDLHLDSKTTVLGFWRIIQLSHFLTSLPPAREFFRPLTTFEKFCVMKGQPRHMVSQMYSLLISPEEDFSLDYFSRWERDLQISFSPEQRAKILLFTFKSSIHTQAQESGYKLLTRWYRTPQVLHFMYPETSDCCWRCGRHPGDLLHLFWSCPKLLPFWTSVKRIMSKFTDREIPWDPAFFLLHHNNIHRKSYRRSILPHLLNAARCCIPRLWKSSSPPSIQMWLSRVAVIARMEDLIHTNRGCHEKYLKTWFYWREFTHTREYAQLLEESVGDRGAESLYLFPFLLLLNVLFFPLLLAFCMIELRNVCTYVCLGIVAVAITPNTAIQCLITIAKKGVRGEKVGRKRVQLLLSTDACYMYFSLCSHSLIAIAPDT